VAHFLNLFHEKFNNMKSLASFLTVALFLTLHGNVTAQEDSMLTDRRVSHFTSIRVQGYYKVFIVQSDSESVKLEAPAEIRDRIVTVVKNGVLKIHNKHDNWSSGDKSWYSSKSWWHKHPEVVVYISVLHLEHISSAGSTTLYFNDGLTVDRLSVRVLGSGHIEGKITATESLASHLSGSGTLKLTGIAKNLKVRIAGSGRFDASKLVTANSSVHILGSGHATVNALETVKARLYGSSALNYYGTARINGKKYGSAAISKL
jgi:hypothetical protein